ncbi:hypothetical protein GCM10008938_18290 [Deinococcus roseus]|uniref:Stress-response A/B barrel domain-containing protein n=2 Tax=Deinococcus roseus TaxID=392414 RepID=A0ABQ2CY73_9DEIO|nr:hypothetical protein GCM10008938_18290 [Deinococcus roseus]
MPGPEQLQEMWRTLKIKTLPDLPADIANVLNQMRSTRINGGAWYAAFQFETHPALDWFIKDHPQHLEASNFFADALLHPVVQQALKAALPEQGISANPILMDTFDLEASLAREIHSGGAYHHTYTSVRQSKNLAASFVDQVQGDLRHQWFAYSPGGFSDPSDSTPWDHSWYGLNSLKRSFWILHVHDVD